MEIGNLNFYFKCSSIQRNKLILKSILVRLKLKITFLSLTKSYKVPKSEIITTYYTPCSYNYSRKFKFVRTKIRKVDSNSTNLALLYDSVYQ